MDDSACLSPAPGSAGFADWARLAEEVAGLGYWRLEADTLAITWSAGLFRMYGLDGQAPPSLEAAMARIHPDDRRAADQSLREALETGRDYVAQARVRRPDGSWRLLLNRATCHRDSTGAVAAVLGAVMDVTEIRMAGEALQASEARHRLIADMVSDLVVRTDRLGVIRDISLACRSLGWEPDELIGRNSLDQVHPEDLPRLRAHGERLWSGETVAGPDGGEHRFRCKDGSWRWLQGHPKLVRDAAGRPLELIDVLRDVTDRRSRDAALAKAAEEAAAAAEAKTRFLANMSHEMRTPLTAILGFAELLGRRADLPADAARQARRIHAAGSQMLSLVDDILAVTRLAAGEVVLDRQPTDLRRFLARVLARHRAAARAKRLTLSSRAPRGRPSVLLLDAKRLQQVLDHLIANAIRFTEQGSILVEASTPAPGELEIAVTDTGPGVPKPLRARLFERFSQGEDSDRRAFGGAGLGLVICKGLVELMGGRIRLDARRRRGARFVFTLSAPVAAPPPAAEPPDVPPRVLLVDDLEVNRTLVRAMLEPLGYAIEEAASGGEAVAAAAQGAFDVIFMDLQMPLMDGLEATRRIRAQAGGAEPAIIALSANVLAGQDRAVREAGMDACLAKPISPAELANAAAHWSRRRRAA